MSLKKIINFFEKVDNQIQGNKRSKTKGDDHRKFLTYVTTNDPHGLSFATLQHEMMGESVTNAWWVVNGIVRSVKRSKSLDSD